MSDDLSERCRALGIDPWSTQEQIEAAEAGGCGCLWLAALLPTLGMLAMLGRLLA